MDSEEHTGPFFHLLLFTTSYFDTYCFVTPNIILLQSCFSTACIFSTFFVVVASPSRILSRVILREARVLTQISIVWYTNEYHSLLSSFLAFHRRWGEGFFFFLLTISVPDCHIIECQSFSASKNVAGLDYQGKEGANLIFFGWEKKNYILFPSFDPFLGFTLCSCSRPFSVFSLPSHFHLIPSQSHILSSFTGFSFRLDQKENKEGEAPCRSPQYKNF